MEKREREDEHSNCEELVWLGLADVGPNSAHIAQHVLELGRMWPDFDPIWIDVDRLRVDFDRIGRTSARIRPNFARIGQFWRPHSAQANQIWGALYRVRPNVAGIRPNLAEVPRVCADFGPPSVLTWPCTTEIVPRTLPKSCSPHIPKSSSADPGELRSCSKVTEKLILESLPREPKTRPKSARLHLSRIRPTLAQRPMLLEFGSILSPWGYFSSTFRLLLDNFGARRDRGGQLFGTCVEQVFGDCRVIAFLLPSPASPGTPSS